MAKGHNARERKLIDDIRVKNTLRRDLEEKIRFVEEKTQELSTCKKRSQEKRIKGSIARYQETIQCLTEKVLAQNEELVKRMTEEKKVSEKEIEDFKKEYKKQHDEYLKAREALEAAIKSKKKKKSPDTTDAVMRRLRKEKKDVDDVQKELDSEAKDKILFEREIKRATAELSHYQS